MTKTWFVQLDMAARGIACWSECGASGGIVTQASLPQEGFAQRGRLSPACFHNFSQCHTPGAVCSRR